MSPIAYAQVLKNELAGPRAIQLPLHIHFGMVVFIVAHIALRGRAAPWWPLAIVFGVEITNEAIDFLGKPAWTPRDTLIDIANTVFWPAVLTLVMRSDQPHA